MKKSFYVLLVLSVLLFYVDLKAISIYLAGPDVFRPNAIALGNAKKVICKKYGLEGVFPLDNELHFNNLSPKEMGLAIFNANKQCMLKCDAVIANMTPYQGPSTDIGTGFEIGFMAAQNKPVFAYTNNPKTFFERTKAFFNNKITIDDKGVPRDPQGNALERFDMVDNLMLDGAVKTSTNAEVVMPQKALADPLEDLTVFEECVKSVAAYFKININS